MQNSDTIVALSTPNGIGAIGLIRLSGPKSLEILSKIFKGKDLKKAESHTLHFGRIIRGEILLDEVVVGIYKGPHSYTGEDVIEITCHGSSYILNTLLNWLIDFGCRMAGPGEFTLKAFLNNKMDLSQSEAVSDLIASENAAFHQVAMKQLRGGFSSELKKIRQKLMDFASLIELELDFSEEDVEFVNRGELQNLLKALMDSLIPLIESFSLGNVLKKGIPVVIGGKPNAGKSTLLNSLINEERAIVSHIPGTTRDTIEVELNIEGMIFRLVDTAGIRESKDEIENLGIEKTFQELEKANIVIYLLDPIHLNIFDIQSEIQDVRIRFSQNNTQFLWVVNKSDQMDLVKQSEFLSAFPELIFISAKEKLNLKTLKKSIFELMDQNLINSGMPIVTNSRHLEALKKTLSAVEKTLQLCQSPNSGELLAFEIKEALYHLGTITGEVSTEDLLGNIFSRFCIGK